MDKSIWVIFHLLFMSFSWHEDISSALGRRGAKRQSKGCSAESKSRPGTSAPLHRQSAPCHVPCHVTQKCVAHLDLKLHWKVTAVNHWKCLESHISVLRGEMIITIGHLPSSFHGDPTEDYSTGTIWHRPRATVQSADGTGCTSIPAVALWGVRRSCSRRIVLASIAWQSGAHFLFEHRVMKLTMKTTLNMTSHGNNYR